MSAITDTAGNPLTYVSLAIQESTDSSVLVIRVPAAANRYLTAIGDASATVKARRTGSGDAFVDIDANPINLTPWAGTDVDFDVKITAGAVTGLKRVALPVKVTPTP